jgi:hypothetical protein
MPGRAQKTNAERKASTSPRNAAVQESRPLVLTETIPVPDVKGRFDHFAAGGGRLFVSELGNNSIALISTGGRALERTITGVREPHPTCLGRLPNHRNHSTACRAVCTGEAKSGVEW